MNSLVETLRTPVAIAVTAFVVVLSAYLIYTSTERRWPYLVAVAVVCIAWTVRELRGKGADASVVRPKLTNAIISSGLLLSVALATVLAARLGWIHR